MGLNLLCLIGLNHNQIEHDNYVLVTFPLRQAERGREALKEGQGVCACMYYFMRANLCGSGQKGDPETLPWPGPQRETWCHLNLRGETRPGEHMCVNRNSEYGMFSIEPEGTENITQSVAI